MKKILFILSIVFVVSLVGCSFDSNVSNDNLIADTEKQQENVSDDNLIVDTENKQHENDSAVVEEDEKETPNDKTQLEEAKNAIFNALMDEKWVKENVSMKKTCFGDDFTGEQELTFEILRDDLAIVQAYSYEANNFGAQLFLVGYKDSKVQVISVAYDTPQHPGHGGFGVDSENMVVVNYWGHQGIGLYTAYKIDNLMFEEIERLEFTDQDEEELRDKSIDEFNKKYNAHALEVKLTEENLKTVM